jgi:hypothetical protein
MRIYSPIVMLVAVALLISCQKNTEVTAAGPQVNFIFKFDSTQARLNGQGNPSVLPSNHAGQSPRFNSMSAHYLELTPNQLTLPGAGQVLYRAPEVTNGGANAIDFSRAKFAGNNQVFLSVPLSSLAAGTYNWLRVSLAYQNYNVYVNASAAGQNIVLDATVASFIGYNTYVGTYKIKDSAVVENANKLQGYWAFETTIPGFGGIVRKGQAPPGATTVPNPLFATSPVPPGSCLVTGQFAVPLVITGTETNDINIIVSLSTNKSFEWMNADGNNTYDPLNGDAVVDMGIRGLIPRRQ